MSRLAELHKAEKELYRQIQAYYTAIRRPWLEWTTFTLALLAASALVLRRFGIGIINYHAEGEWLVAMYWVCLFLFLCLDSIFTKARHPLPVPFGFASFGRIYEKFAMQGRAWQILLVLMLPVTARLIAAIMAATAK